MKVDSQKSHFTHSTINFFSGTAGGMAQVLVGHPFDTLKVRLQTSHGVYKGLADCFWKTVRQEGPFGLYKGASSPLLGIGLCNAVVFTANGFFRKLLSDGAHTPLPLSKVATAGALSGMIMAFVNCPIELLKVRLQVQDPSQPKKYSGLLDCAQKAYMRNGLRGLYRGISITWMRDWPSFAAYFGSYEAMKRYFGRNGQPSSPGQMIFAGGMAGIMAWIICYPQDVIKSRLQSSDQHKNTIDCLRAIWRTHGLSGFTKGFLPTMLRAFPANAATFFAYEMVSHNLNQLL